MKTLIKFQYVFIIIGLIASFSIYYLISELENKIIYARFDNEVKQFETILSEHVKLNNIALLSIQVLYMNSDEVTSSEFYKASKLIHNNFKSLTTVEWIPYIKQENREQFTAHATQTHDGYEIIDFADGAPIKAAIREWYYPVLYAYPLEENRRSIGFDVGTSPAKLKALQTARDSNKSVATEPLELIHGGMGYLVVAPIYLGEPYTLKLRPEKLKGFVLGVYKMDSIINGAISLHSSENFNFILSDVTKGKNTKIYSSIDIDEKETIKSDANMIQLRMKNIIPGREWKIEAWSTPHYISENKSHLPEFVLLASISFMGVLGAYLHINNRAKRLSLLASEYKTSSFRDALTKINNRAYFDFKMESIWTRNSDNQTPISLILIDIDWFKDYNDLNGHVAGDKCLALVAQELKKLATRSDDVVARYGGEEFAILMSGFENVDQYASAVCSRVESLCIEAANKSVSKFITVSVGVGTITPDRIRTPDDLIRLADRALYDAKSAGRNNSIIYRA